MEKMSRQPSYQPDPKSSERKKWCNKQVWAIEYYWCINENALVNIILHYNKNTPAPYQNTSTDIFLVHFCHNKDDLIDASIIIVMHINQNLSDLYHIFVTYLAAVHGCNII